jgi:hypothetical protein
VIRVTHPVTFNIQVMFIVQKRAGLVIQSIRRGQGLLENFTQAQRGSRGIDLLILNLGTGYGWVVSAKPRSLYPRNGAPVSIAQGAG